MIRQRAERRRPRQPASVPRAGRACCCCFLPAAGHRRPRARLHRHGPHSARSRGFTLDNFARMPTGDRRLGQRARHHADLRALHARRSSTSASRCCWRWSTTACRARRRLLPRRLAAAADEPVGRLRAALELGRRAQRLRACSTRSWRLVGMPPVDLNSDAPLLAHRPGQRLHRRVARHDHLHLRDPLDPRAPVPCRARRRRRRPRDRAPHHPAGDPLAAPLHDDPPDAVAAGELRIHLADHRRRPVLRHDGLFAVRLPARVRERPVRLRRRAVAGPGRRSASSSRWCCGASWTCARCCSRRGSRSTDGGRGARRPRIGPGSPRRGRRAAMGHGLSLRLPGAGLPAGHHSLSLARHTCLLGARRHGTLVLWRTLAVIASRR